MVKDEQELIETVGEFAKKLPKFPDGRVDYTDSDRAPVLCVFVKYADKILLLKRSDKVLAYKGKWNTVVGFLDELKPVREKIIEELREELGVEENNISSIRVGKPHDVSDKIIGKIWIVYPALIELKEKPEINLDWEHTEYKWIKPEELKDYDTPPGLDRSLENVLGGKIKPEEKKEHGTVKVAVVGAGIVGTYLAWRLAKKGLDVSVFESKEKIGGKVCSGLISRRIWHFFPENKSLVMNEISSASVHFPRKDIEIRFSPRMLVLDRRKLEGYAADFAKAAGAKIFLGMKVARVLHVRGKKPQAVLEKNGKRAFLEFDYVIGCDGAHSAVRKSLQLKDPKMRLGILAYGKIKKNQTVGAVDVFPAKNGFNWVIPRGAGEAEYGTLEEPAEAKKAFERFCKKQKLIPGKVGAAPIPEGLILSNHGRIALCGDAAGLTKKWSGGGVIWGLTAAHMLARDFPDFGKYNSQSGKFFGPKMAFGRIGTKAAVWLGMNAPFLLPKKIRIDSDWGI